MLCSLLCLCFVLCFIEAYQALVLQLWLFDFPYDSNCPMDVLKGNETDGPKVREKR